MARLPHPVLILLFSMAALCGCLFAQTEKTVTIRMLDGKTGKLIAASGFLVRINHEQTTHGNWVVGNENGTGKLTLPKGASVLSIQGNYDSSMLTYVNCDSVSEKGNPVDRWYAVSEILSLGIAAPNGCGKPKDTTKIKAAAKPGEFVFFVRKQNWREQFQDDYSSH